MQLAAAAAVRLLAAAMLDCNIDRRVCVPPERVVVALQFLKRFADPRKAFITVPFKVVDCCHHVDVLHLIPQADAATNELVNVDSLVVGVKHQQVKERVQVPWLEV